MMETSNLVERVKKQDRKAFEELYHNYYSMGFSLALQFVKNEEDAMDIIQDAFITVYNKINSLEDINKFKSWYMQIVANKCKNFLKKKNPRAFSELVVDDADVLFEVEDEDRDFQPEEAVDYTETVRIVDEMLNELPEDQKMSLLLFYANDLKISEIANSLGVSEATVKSRLKYGKNKLKTQVEEYEKKNGVKLRGLGGISIMPFLKWMFSSKTGSIPPSSKVLACCLKAIGSSAQGAGVVSSGVITHSLASKILALSATQKIISVAVAGAVVVGATVTASVAINQEIKKKAVFISSAITSSSIISSSAEETNDFEEYIDKNSSKDVSTDKTSSKASSSQTSTQDKVDNNSNLSQTETPNKTESSSTPDNSNKFANGSSNRVTSNNKTTSETNSKASSSQTSTQDKVDNNSNLSQTKTNTENADTQFDINAVYHTYIDTIVINKKTRYYGYVGYFTTNKASNTEVILKTFDELGIYYKEDYALPSVSPTEYRAEDGTPIKFVGPDTNRLIMRDQTDLYEGKENGGVYGRTVRVIDDEETTPEKNMSPENCDILYTKKLVNYLGYDGYFVDEHTQEALNKGYSTYPTEYYNVKTGSNIKFVFASRTDGVGNEDLEIQRKAFEKGIGSIPVNIVQYADTIPKENYKNFKYDIGVFYHKDKDFDMKPGGLLEDTWTGDIEIYTIGKDDSKKEEIKNIYKDKYGEEYYREVGCFLLGYYYVDGYDGVCNVYTYYVYAP